MCGWLVGLLVLEGSIRQCDLAVSIYGSVEFISARLIARQEVTDRKSTCRVRLVALGGGVVKGV